MWSNGSLARWMLQPPSLPTRKWTAIGAMRRQKSIAKCNLVFSNARFFLCCSCCCCGCYNRCQCCMATLCFSAYAGMNARKLVFIKYITIGYKCSSSLQSNIFRSFMLWFVSALEMRYCNNVALSAAIFFLAISHLDFATSQPQLSCGAE